MVNPRQRIIKDSSFFKKTIEFFDKNWQAIAIILGIAAVFIWYQALNIRALDWNKAFDGVSLGIRETAKNLSPNVIPQTSPPLLQSEKEPIRGPSRTTFSEKAQRNQGVTHLARQALNEYLESTKPNIHISKEQKIYIEDYLKDKTGKKRLLVGEVVTFEKDAIEQAIDLSEHLSSKQIAGLGKYANRVPSLTDYKPKI